eukprot:NODE_698_length_1246_cov_167.093567_g558_i0.p1 GENE.NODE_698_length_1246_cov_167.093567_g558_i0~~NODE_698_length_1246_cov_167.093567_g558_i0.p1  ORF type:complete len:287 (-),score=60.82 NODE_698_length_1246_cov_167.093567_g558_i0:319-1179(-)
MTSTDDAKPHDPKPSISWADDEPGDDSFLQQATPERTETEPDKNGIKKVIEYVYRDGKKFKVTKTVKVKKEERKVSKVVEERKTWKKFGKAATVTPGEGNITEVADEIIFELSAQKRMVRDQERKVNEKIEQIVRQTALRMEGKDPSNAYVAPSQRAAAAAASKAEDTAKEEGPAESRYVPPSMRGGKGGAGGGSTVGGGRDDLPTIRVTNLSESVTEQDLRDLFTKFGSVNRIYLAKDRETRASKGFAFVTFMNKEDAQRALDQLQGFGYDHLILSVEWAKPSAT